MGSGVNMEITQYDVQERHKMIPLTGVPSAQSLEKSGWLFGGPIGVGKTADLRDFRTNLRDPRAEQMVQRYAGLQSHFVIEALRAHYILGTWLISNFFLKKLKRAMDLLIVLCGLPFVFPIMLLAAVLIKIDSPGPVIFRQQRVGKWGRPFTCYKFRSMFIDAEQRKAALLHLNESDEVVFKMKCDPRVTRVGHIIRKLSIDELPQIFNVLKGDMSIVGPRPPIPFEVALYTFDIYRRLDIIPGITGLQQISGRSEIPFQRWVELDVEYIRCHCFKKDVEILLKTIPAVLSAKGAY